MRAEIFDSGHLVVSAENPLEGYALKMWQKNFPDGESVLIVNSEGDWRAYDSLKEFNAMFKELGPQSKRFKEWIKLHPREEELYRGKPDGIVATE